MAGPSVGRPKMKEAKKRVAISVSLSPSVIELCEKAENKSHFIDISVQTSRALSMVIQKLRARELTMETALEELEDVADIWEAELEESTAFK